MSPLERDLFLMSERFGVELTVAKESPLTIHVESKGGPDGKLVADVEVAEGMPLKEVMVAIECMKQTARAKYGLR